MPFSEATVGVRTASPHVAGRPVPWLQVAVVLLGIGATLSAAAWVLSHLYALRVTLPRGPDGWVQLSSRPGGIEIRSGKQWSERIEAHVEWFRWGTPERVSEELLAIGIRGVPRQPPPPPQDAVLGFAVTRLPARVDVSAPIWPAPLLCGVVVAGLLLAKRRVQNRRGFPIVEANG